MDLTINTVVMDSDTFFMNEKRKLLNSVGLLHKELRGNETIDIEI